MVIQIYTKKSNNDCDQWSILFYPKGSITLKPKGAILFGQKGQSSVAFPDVTLIEESAFDGCKSMIKVTFGKNITLLKNYAFSGVPMVECKLYATEPPVLKDTPLSSSSIDKATATLYVPKGSLTAYQESDWATYFGNIIEMEE